MVTLGQTIRDRGHVAIGARYRHPCRVDFGVLADGIDYGAIGARPHSHGRYDDRLFGRREAHRYIDIFAGPECRAVVAKFCLCHNGARGLINGIIEKSKCSPIPCPICRGRVYVYRRTAFHTLVQLRQVTLWQPESDEDRIILGNGDNAGPRAEIRAFADGDVTQAPVIGCADFHMLQSDLVCLQRCTVGIDLCGCRIACGLCLLITLLRLSVLLQQIFGTGQGCFCFGKVCLVTGDVGLVPGDCSARGPIIQLGNQVPCLDLLTITRGDIHHQSLLQGGDHRAAGSLGKAGGGDIKR